jgi:hypothetical protein
MTKLEKVLISAALAAIIAGLQAYLAGGTKLSVIIMGAILVAAKDIWAYMSTLTDTSTVSIKGK